MALSRRFLLGLIVLGCLVGCRSEIGETPRATDITPLPLTSPPPSTPRQLSKEELKRKGEVERMMLKGQNLHDGSGELASIGDLDSIPSLLVVLRESPLGPDGGMVCTRAHAINALRTITGANPGPRTEDWEQWWNERNKNHE